MENKDKGKDNKSSDRLTEIPPPPPAEPLQIEIALVLIINWWRPKRGFHLKPKMSTVGIFEMPEFKACFWNYHFE